MIRVHIPGDLRPFTGGADLVELGGAPCTAGELLRALFVRHPGLRDRVMTEQGEVRMHVNIFVSGESIRFTGELQTPVADDAEVHVIPAVSGG